MTEKESLHDAAYRLYRSAPTGGPAWENLTDRAKMSWMRKAWEERESTPEDPSPTEYSQPIQDLILSANKLANEFAWSSVRPDCLESKIYLTELIEKVRNAIDKIPEVPTERIPLRPPEEAVDRVMKILDSWFDGTRRIDRHSEMVQQLASLIEKLPTESTPFDPRSKPLYDLLYDFEAAVRAADYKSLDLLSMSNELEQKILKSPTFAIKTSKRGTIVSDELDDALSFCYAILGALSPTIAADVLRANPEDRRKAHRAIYESRPQEIPYDRMMREAGQD